MTNKPTANFAAPLICDRCGKTIEAKPGETYSGSTDGRVWHYGCSPSARSSTPQEPDFPSDATKRMAKTLGTDFVPKVAQEPDDDAE